MSLFDFSPLTPCPHAFSTFPHTYLSLHWSRSLKISHLLHPSPPSHHVRHTSPKRPAEFDIKPTPAGEARKNGTKRSQLPRVSLNHSLLANPYQPTNLPTNPPVPTELNTSLSPQGFMSHSSPSAEVLIKEYAQVTRKAQQVSGDGQGMLCMLSESDREVIWVRGPVGMSLNF